MKIENIILNAENRLDFLLPLPCSNNRNVATNMLHDLLMMSNRLILHRILITVGNAVFTNSDYIPGRGGLSLRAIQIYNIDELDDSMCKFKFSSDNGNIGLIIVDSHEAVIIEINHDNNPLKVEVISENKKVEALQDHFERLWFLG